MCHPTEEDERVKLVARTEIAGSVVEVSELSSEEYVEPRVEVEASTAHKETILFPVKETVSSSTELIQSNVEHIGT